MNSIEGRTEGSRIQYLDTFRGWLTIFVMTVHTDIQNAPLHTLVQVCMLSGFFFISGLLTKEEAPIDFFKNRILKLWICQIVLAYVQAFLGVESVVSIVHDPKSILTIFVERSIKILQGEAIWFITALLMVSMVSYLLIWLMNKCNISSIWIIVISACISILSYFLLVEEGKHMSYYIDVALVNQFFFILGYLYKKKGFDRKLEKSLVTKFAFIISSTALVTILVVFSGFTGYDVRNNGYNNIFGFLFISTLCIFSLLSICMMVDKVPLITFMGSHSLLYFAFGSHGYFFARQIEKLYNPTLVNPYIRIWMYAIIGSIAMVLPAMFIDRFCPILNGHLKLSSKERASN